MRVRGPEADAGLPQHLLQPEVPSPPGAAQSSPAAKFFGLKLPFSSKTASKQESSAGASDPLDARAAAPASSHGDVSASSRASASGSAAMRPAAQSAAYPIMPPVARASQPQPAHAFSAPSNQSVGATSSSLSGTIPKLTHAQLLQLQASAALAALSASPASSTNNSPGGYSMPSAPAPMYGHQHAPPQGSGPVYPFMNPLMPHAQTQAPGPLFAQGVSPPAQLPTVAAAAGGGAYPLPPAAYMNPYSYRPPMHPSLVAMQAPARVPPPAPTAASLAAPLLAPSAGLSGGLHKLQLSDLSSSLPMLGPDSVVGGAAAGPSPAAMSLGYGQLSQGHGGGMGYLMPCMTANQHIGPQSLNHALSGASVGSARTVASVGSTTPSKPNTVKVLLTYGGSSTTSVTGGWEYTGGETRLLGGLQTEISYTDLVARVANEVHMKLGVEAVLRYELPGAPGTLVDVRSDEDVANMWSEWSDFCAASKQPTFKLHLYVDRPVSNLASRLTSPRGSGLRGSGSGGAGWAPTPITGTDSDAGSVKGRDNNSGSHPVGQSAGTSSASPSQPGSPPRHTPSAMHQQYMQQLQQQQQLEQQQQQQQQAALQAAQAGQGRGAMSPLAAGAPPQELQLQQLHPGMGQLGGAGAQQQQQQPGGGGGAGGAPRVTPSMASFDKLLTRVKTVVEIIRPCDLRIVRFIGSGGFADCYLAKWLGVDVAVKCFRDLPGTHTSSRAAVKDLLREASVLSGLRHPNVLCLYAVTLPDKLAVEHGVAGPAARAAYQAALKQQQAAEQAAQQAQQEQLDTATAHAANTAEGAAGGGEGDAGAKQAAGGAMPGQHWEQRARMDAPASPRTHSLLHALTPVLEEADAVASSALAKLHSGGTGGAGSSEVLLRLKGGKSTDSQEGSRMKMGPMFEQQANFVPSNLGVYSSTPNLLAPHDMHDGCIVVGITSSSSAADEGSIDCGNSSSRGDNAQEMSTAQPEQAHCTAAAITAGRTSSGNMRRGVDRSHVLQGNIHTLPAGKGGRLLVAGSPAPEGGPGLRGSPRACVSDLGTRGLQQMAAGAGDADAYALPNLRLASLRTASNISAMSPGSAAGSARLPSEGGSLWAAQTLSSNPSTVASGSIGAGMAARLNSAGPDPNAAADTAAIADGVKVAELCRPPLPPANHAPVARALFEEATWAAKPARRSGDSARGSGGHNSGANSPSAGVTSPFAAVATVRADGPFGSEAVQLSREASPPQPMLGSRRGSSPVESDAVAGPAGVAQTLTTRSSGNLPSRLSRVSVAGSTSPSPGAGAGAGPVAGAGAGAGGPGCSPGPAAVAEDGMPGYSGPLSKLPQPEVEEDEATKRVVAAAEAAAATSADQESQSAVSEGLLQRPALVAEFLSGCSLGSAIARQADFLSSNLVLTKVALDAARGMEYCHGKRVTHWNLKTGNLIVGFSSDKVPLCKIADVGLSRPRQLHALDEVGVARVLPWAAPELCRTPESVNEKVDVYSFGVVLWSMWSRRNPSDGQEIARMFLRIMQGHVVRPPIPGTPEWEAVFPGAPCPPEPAPGWRELMERCWAQDPAARPSFSEVTASLITMFNSAKASKRAARAAAATAGGDPKLGKGNPVRAG